MGASQRGCSAWVLAGPGGMPAATAQSLVGTQAVQAEGGHPPRSRGERVPQVGVWIEAVWKGQLRGHSGLPLGKWKTCALRPKFVPWRNSDARSGTFTAAAL